LTRLWVRRKWFNPWEDNKMFTSSLSTNQIWFSPKPRPVGSSRVVKGCEANNLAQTSDEIANVWSRYLHSHKYLCLSTETSLPFYFPSCQSVRSNTHMSVPEAQDNSSTRASCPRRGDWCSIKAYCILNPHDHLEDWRMRIQRMATIGTKNAVQRFGVCAEHLGHTSVVYYPVTVTSAPLGRTTIEPNNITYLSDKRYIVAAEMKFLKPYFKRFRRGAEPVKCL
jgi:hypothetical protein